MQTLPMSIDDLQAMREGAGQAAALLRVVGNEHRLMVLCLLLQSDEMSVGALLQEVGLSQSALSQHLARMREEGLVACRRESQTMYYRIADPAVGRLIATLKDIFCP
ncbi:MAG: ArsR/SmtB family transcription factor [Pigmentiphaga sp.]